MKCDDCENERWYTTGFDEYPSCTKISYCQKGHWEHDPGPQCHEQSKIEDPWLDCKDYTKKKEGI